MDYHAKLWACIIMGYFLEHNPRVFMKSLVVCRYLFVLAHLVTNHGLHMSNKISCMRFASDLCSSECEQWFHCEMHGIHEHRKSDFHGLIICRHSSHIFPLPSSYQNIFLKHFFTEARHFHYVITFYFVSLSLKKKKAQPLVPCASLKMLLAAQ